MLGALGLIILNKIFGDPPAPPSLPGQPPAEPIVPRGSPNPPSSQPPQQTTKLTDALQSRPLRRGFDLPPAGETRFVPNELMLDIPATVPSAVLDRIAARHSMTRLESTRIRLTGRTLYRWRLDRGGSIRDMIRALSGERQIAGAQPIYFYRLSQSETLNSDQYSPLKINLLPAHRIATGNGVLIAVIDSTVDKLHPDLGDAIVDSFATDQSENKPDSHGTGMAGVIAAQHTMLGIAPGAKLLTVHAFSSSTTTAEGTTFNILRGLDWAAERGARIVNMSFAGPADPRLRDALREATKKGMTLIAAAGNAGPQSAPLYPAAYPNVIAVTATDSKDRVFSRANRGDHITVASPGVDILAPAPDGAYQLSTGTSVAAAQVSGVVALLIERNPKLTPRQVLQILTQSSKDLGPKGRDRDFGFGLVNALEAVTQAGPQH